MGAELMRSHKFCRIFLPVRSEAERREQVLNSFQILTTETMFLFTIALCYDVESPSDDGSCIDLTSVGACLARKSVTDSSSSYCTWNTTDEQCSYSDPSFSIQVCVLCMCVCVFVCAACELVVRSLFVCLQWVFMTALCLFLFLFMS